MLRSILSFYSPKPACAILIKSVINKVKQMALVFRENLQKKTHQVDLHLERCLLVCYTSILPTSLD